MAPASKAFLVIRRTDGLGDVFPLQPGQRYTMGRAKTNEIVLKDDLCSRQHAEVYQTEGTWRVRDCTSLNGTRVNEMTLEGEWELSPGDEVGVGRSTLVFVEDLAQLPAAPTAPTVSEVPVTIKERLGQTRYDLVSAPAESTDVPTPQRHRISRDLSLLYRLALDMGAATSYADVVEVVLNGLLEGTTADTGAVLSVGDGKRLEVTAARGSNGHDSHSAFSEFVSNEVLRSKEAVLAEDVAQNRHLRNRDSLEAMGAHSLICAPVVVGDKVKALIHLYGTNPLKAFTREDLELTVAVAKQLAVVSQALQRQLVLHEENQRLKAQVVASEVELVGTSPAIEDIKSQIARVAGTNATVLIRGESGSGKELVARAIHLASNRRQEPFVCLNCAALAESLLESELFGHEKGAFTGATDKKIGKFEAADQGTLFLDELGEMNPSAQAKLLRILEGHAYERVGGTEPIQVNVRVVAATNRPLEEGLAAGKFRRDLYFRLQVVEVRVPPLRDRPGDIPQLADHFLQRFLRETGRRIKGFTPAAMEKMRAYAWPGNVRELRNVVERAVALGTKPVVDAPDIWLSNIDGPPKVATTSDAEYQPLTLDELEKRHIEATLRHTEWNKSQAANILEIERSTLDRKIRAYDIKR